MVPPTARAGDLLCILRGGETPYVLRRVDSRGAAAAAEKREGFVFVGEAYVAGLMEDASGLFEAGGAEFETFRLR
jgi:hypothetical protein